MGVFSKYIKLYELYNNQVLGLVIKIDTLEGLANLISNINHQRLLPQYIYIMASQEFIDKNSNYLIEYFSNLCMLNKLIPLVPADNWGGHVSNTENLDYIAYLADNTLLTDLNLIKKCKKNIMSGKQIPEVQLINLR